MTSTRLKIYAITHDILGVVFWEVFRRGLMDAAARYDIDVEHLRPGKFSPEIQAGLIEGAIDAKPDGLISTIPDIAAVDAPLRHAVSKGIPVIAINAKDPRPPSERIPYLFYIGGDDHNAGRLAGDYLLNQAPVSAALCIDHYLHDHICHSDRYRGFAAALESKNVPVSRLRVPGGDAQGSAKCLADYFGENPTVDAILSLGPPGAQAVLDARKLLSSARRLSHMTFDVAQLQIEGIRAGEILATIDSQQYLQGYLSVQHMWLHLVQGFTMAADIYTGPAIVDARNIAAAEEGVKRGIR